MEDRLKADLKMTLVDKLGQGCFGQVVRGRDEQGRHSAVKIVNKAECK